MNTHRSFLAAIVPLVAIPAFRCGPPVDPPPVAYFPDYSPSADVICNRNPESVAGLYLNAANLPTSNVEEIDTYVLPDPTNCGANVIVPWSEVDRGPGASPRYDWSFVVDSAAKWVDAGKRVNLLVWGSAQNAGQQFTNADGTSKPMTPQFVLDGVPSVECNGVTVPVFYDDGYQALYREFARAVADEFGGERWVGYLRFGIGVGAETYPANGVPKPGECTDKWTNEAGYTNDEWERHATSFVDEFLPTLNAEAPIIVTVNELFGPGYAAQFGSRLGAVAIANGFGVGTQGLTKGAIDRYGDGTGTCYADWCRLFEEGVAGQLPPIREVQTTANSNPTGAGNVGSLVDLLPFALARNANVIELYRMEWRVAATNPDYAAALSAAAEALAS
jgi:hypothetical protein